jgi:hypothetical protein
VVFSSTLSSVLARDIISFREGVLPRGEVLCIHSAPASKKGSLSEAQNRCTEKRLFRRRRVTSGRQGNFYMRSRGWGHLLGNWYYPTSAVGAARFELATFTVSG